MKYLQYIIIAILFAGLGFGVSLYFQQAPRKGGEESLPLDKAVSQLSVTNFQECVATGNPVQESYPRKCTHGSKTYTENIGNILEKADLIRMRTPLPNQVIDQPLAVEGEARGQWFFEGDFPVILTDWDGLIIAQGHATAQSDWMTEEFVPFKAVLEYEEQTLYNRGTLILQKDNPSGLPEFDDALEFQIKFWEE
jgi:hypothetical protein